MGFRFRSRTACAPPLSPSSTPFWKPVQPPDFTAGWDFHSFGMRERRHCASVWIRYLHKSSTASDWSHVTVLRLGFLDASLIFQGLLSRIASAALLQPLSRVGSPRHDGQAEAVATSAFHPALPPELGNQQVQVPLRDRTEPARHHQQPYRSDHHHHPPSFAPVGSILPSPLFLHRHGQCSLNRLTLHRPSGHRPVRKPLHTPAFPNQPRQTSPTAPPLAQCPPHPIHPTFPSFPS